VRNSEDLPMHRLSATLRLRTRRIYFVVLIALGLEVATGVFVWHVEQWRLLILAAIFPTLLLAMVIGLILAGERWTIVRDFRVRHPTILTALIMGVAAATVVGLAVGPVGIVIGPLVLGFWGLIGWAVQKAREYFGT
jgi:hypothetical protein